MGKEVQVKGSEQKAPGKKRAALYRAMVESAFEIGEVARIENEIQKLYPPAFPQLRCPDWDILSPHHLPGPHHPPSEHHLPSEPHARGRHHKPGENALPAAHQPH
jgi:hypothetical protein